MEPPSKRRNIQRPLSPGYTLDSEDSYEPYIPVAQRREAKLAKLNAWGIEGKESQRKSKVSKIQDQDEKEMDEQERRENLRKERTLLMEAQDVHLRRAEEGQGVLISMMKHSKSSRIPEI